MYDPHLEEYQDVLAARYALGVAAASEIAIAEARLDLDDDFAARVARYDAQVAEFDSDLAGIAPSLQVWDRITAAIDAVEASPFTHTVRPADRHWEPFAPGIDRKVLHTDKAAGSQIVLYRVAPGTSFGAHGHLIDEECLVLDGEIEVDGITAGTGDVHIAFAATRHGVISSPKGALLYVRADLHMQG